MVTLDYLLVRNAHPIGISNVIMSSKVVNYELMDIYIYTHICFNLLYTYIYIYIYIHRHKKEAQSLDKVYIRLVSQQKKKKGLHKVTSFQDSYLISYVSCVTVNMVYNKTRHELCRA